jgi:hypothetical protein
MFSQVVVAVFLLTGITLVYVIAIRQDLDVGENSRRNKRH